MHPHHVRRLLARAVAGALVALVGLLAVAALTQRVAVVSTYGVSMQPVYAEGDLVIVSRAREYAVGDIVAYRLPADRRVVLHRIVGTNDEGLVMKGDNNPAADTAHPSPDMLLGRAVLHVPHGGTVFRRLTDPPVLAGAAFLLLGAGGTAARTRRQRRQARMTTPPAHAARRASRPTSTWFQLPPAVQRLTAAAAAAGLAGLAVGAVGLSQPPTTAGAISPSQTAMRFDYTADVGRTPAYDSSVVRAPAPLFRSRVSDVVMHLDYDGPAGTMRVRAELSTAGGWRSSIPLRGTAPVSGEDPAVDVPLDLDALSARAERGTAAAGLPLTGLSVRLVAEIHSFAGTFNPELELELSPTALSVDNLAALVVRDPSAQPPLEAEPGRVVVAGQSFDVWQLRTWGVSLLALALLLGSVAAKLARRTPPLPESVVAARRYAGVLLEVHPLPSTPGRPLVDVPDLASLVRLAERYGLLVLHWSRSGVQTYVVQDDGTTYRYRTSTAPSAEDVNGVDIDGSRSAVAA